MCGFLPHRWNKIRAYEVNGAAPPASQNILVGYGHPGRLLQKPSLKDFILKLSFTFATYTACLLATVSPTLAAAPPASAPNKSAAAKGAPATPGVGLPLLAVAPGASLARGREALTDRRYADAAKLLQAAALEPSSAEEAALLLGNAQFSAKDYGAAIAAYDALIQKFPTSRWLKKARFKKADALAAMGKWAQAAAIYEPELEYIVSVDRREQVATTYLKYADQYFAPVKKDKADEVAPNFPHAKALYLKALEIGLTPGRTAAVLLRVAQSDYEARDYSSAVQEFERILREYPRSEAAANARIGIGLANLKAGNMRGARRALRDFITDFPGHSRRAEAFLAIAQSYGVPSPASDKELELGVAALRDFLENFPNHERALEAESWIGLSYFNRERQEDAVRELKLFISCHADDKTDTVAMAKYRLGAALLRQKKFDDAIAVWQGFLRDHPVHAMWNQVQRELIDAQYAIGEEAYKANKYDEARRAWDVFTDKYPLDTRNADIMFRLGVMQSDAKKYEEAIVEWRKVISKYGATEAASRAQFMIAQTYEKLDRWDDAFAALKLVQGRYQADAQARLATLKARRMVVYTERAFTTRETPTLRLVTRNVARVQLRAYRVDMRDYFLKTHSIRGVDQLDLNLIAPDKTWTIDTKGFAPYRELETTVTMPFEGAGKGPGVWAIVCRAQDAEKADDNRTDETDAAPGVLEATSIVATTDMGIITKATRNDVFVWAENLVTQQPVPGAQVLVSDGGKIVARGTTDAQGVFHYPRPATEAGDDMAAEVNVPSQRAAHPQAAPKPGLARRGGRSAPAAAHPVTTGAPDTASGFPADSIRVLAVSAGNFASTEGSLGTVAQIAGLRPTGFLYTDRPLYRPGQVVELRGIVRQVNKGAYTFTAGTDYSLVVTSPSGALLHSRTVQLNEWGTFSDSLTLPAEAAPGGYRISLTRDVGKDGLLQPLSAGGGFNVASYKLDKIRLAIAPEKTVYLRGETVTGKVTAKYYYGEPLRRRKIRFGWKDGVGTDFETDDKGEFSFSIPTRDFEEDEAVSLWARLDDEGAQSRSTIYVAAVGVNTSLTLLRDVYLAGEGFEVTVAATDLANKPYAGDFKLHALKLEKTSSLTSGTQSGEREVAQVAVHTGKDGTAKAMLNLKEAGSVILRLEGKDGNGNPVTSETSVQIAGEDDEVRLRVLADTDTLKSGDTASIRVLWRGPKPEAPAAALSALDGPDVKPAPAPASAANEATPRLALVTYEGDRIYGHQLVALARGENTIHLPVEAKLAPIFRLSVSLMDGDDLHLANKWFAVTRELQVKVETMPAGAGGAGLTKASYRPGDKVRVKVTTTDQNGKPVAAELSLSAVDEALLSAGGNVLPISAILGARDASSNPVLTSASNTFNFTAEARQRVLEVREADNFARTMLAGQVNEYPDVPRGHWAYDALDRLSRVGVIEPRPGGKYYGNQPLTRYEVAVAIARALKNTALPANSQGMTGAEANDMMKALRTEFAPELGNLGVRMTGIEDRRAVIEPQVGKPPRLTITPGILHRSGVANYADVARQFNLFKIDGSPVSAGLAPPPNGNKSQGGGFGGSIGGALILGPQGPAGPTGQITESGALGGGSSERTFYASVPRAVSSSGASDMPLFYRPIGVEQLAAIDPGNALIVLGTPDVDALRSNFAETAFWNGHVVTDATGTANVEFTLPDSLTQWRVTGRGVTLDTLVGEGEDKFVSTKPFWVELQAPPILQSGDASVVGAVLHNSSEKAVQSNVTLRAQFDGGAEKAQTQTVSIEAGGSTEVRFDLDVPDAHRAGLTLVAEGGGQNDSEKQSVAVRPWGIDRSASVGGFAQDDRSVEVALPTGEYASGTLSVVVGPPTPAAMLDMVENPGGFGWRQPLAASTVLRLSTLVRAARYLTASGNDKPRTMRLSRDIEGLIARLVIAQNQGGGWSWTLPSNKSQQAGGNGRESDLKVSAEAVAAMAGARDLGFAVPGATLDKGLNYLAKQFQDAAAADNETKAMILYAQSAAGSADFAFVNGLYRLRNSLNARSLAYLALTLQRMERDVMAREIADLLAGRTSAESLRAAATKTTASPAEPSTLALDATETEDVALAALAMTEVEPKNAMLAPMVELLWAKRGGTDWAAPRATGYALAALLENAVAARTLPEKYKLTVNIDGKAARTIDVDANATANIVTIPYLKPQAKVSFNLEGRGTYAYSVLLTGFTKQGLLDDDAVAAMRKRLEDPWTILSSDGMSVRRSYTVAPRMWNGKPLPRGSSILTNLNGDESGWDATAHDVAVGEKISVSLSWTVPYDRLKIVGDTIVVREPLPAGARVLEETIQGGFERYQLGDREITFFYSRKNYGYASYDLYGAQPGHYRVLPAKVWSFDKPGHYAFSTYKDMQVLPRGAKGTDASRVTPDEIYYLAKWSYDRAQAAIARGEEPAPEDLKTAETNLKDLFDRDMDPKGWKLNASSGKDVANMLFTLALRGDDYAGTVRFFEVLRERHPDLVIAFPEIVKTAKAYGKIGETEREVQVLRATAEASFNRETGIAGTLVDEGEHRASYEYLADRAVEYPDLANVESAVYTLAQSISQRAEAVGKNGGKDEAKSLAALSGTTVRDFLVLYPENPLGDEASFTYAVNLVEQGRFADAIAWTDRCRARYKDSLYADDYDYIATYASFLAERYDVALKIATALAADDYLQPGGEHGPSSYRAFALYIAAQIHHARGELGPAMELYRQVSQQFPDARESADFFDQKSLKLPEVTVAGAGDKVEIKATGRNIGKAQIAVYKVDLLQFYQERRSLVDLGQMNLAGIKPAWESTLDFGPTKFADIEKTVALTLPEKGAYFVTLKAADGSRPFVSGVVVRSGLEVEVQEDATSGRVRVNVMRRADSSAGKAAADSGPQPKAEVWAIGTGNDEFRKGTTDLRGIVALDDVRGRATVIAFKGGEYAFYRGEAYLQQPAGQAAGGNNNRNTPAASAPQTGQKAQVFKDQARDMYMTNKNEIVNRNSQALQGAMTDGKSSAGVSAGLAF